VLLDLGLEVGDALLQLGRQLDVAVQYVGIEALGEVEGRVVLDDALIVCVVLEALEVDPQHRRRMELEQLQSHRLLDH